MYEYTQVQSNTIPYIETQTWRNTILLPNQDCALSAQLLDRNALLDILL